MTPRKIRVRTEIKEFAEVMEHRMRFAAEKVAQGEILHRRFMSRGDFLAALERNVEQLREPVDAAAALVAAADIANYARFAAELTPGE